MSDNPHGAWKLGTFANLVGDSSAGKTFTALTALAECANDPRFDNYILINDDAEHRNDFDIEYLYGKKTAERIKAPKYKDGEALFSDTIEDFELYVNRLLDGDKPFIYILDSLDSVSSEQEKKLCEENLKKREAGKKEDGSYGMAKPKKVSELLRITKSKLRKTKSFVLILSQTRSKIGLGFGEKRRAGGDALDFYCGDIGWIARMKELKKTINKRERAIGIQSRVRTKKNSITGKKRDADIFIYYDFGIDDIQTSIDYLVFEDFFEMKKNTILCPDMDFEGSKVSFISFIEENDYEEELRNMVGKCWNDIENNFRFNNRKRRFK